MRSKPCLRYGWKSAAILLFVLGAVAAAPLPESWKHWRYSRLIELAPVNASRLTSVTVPTEVFQRAQLWLPDVRVMDDLGAETPFTILIRAGSKSTVSRVTKLHEKSFAAGRYTQVVLEIGEQAPFHNAVEIQTPESDFIEWVRIEASDDGRIWRLVQQRAPIFRFRKDCHEGTQVVHYSENNAHFLRLQILDGAKQFAVSSASVLYQTVEPPERVQLPATLNLLAKPIPEHTSWTTDLGSMEAPVSDVRFDVAAPAEFIRSVEVDESSDNREWRSFARGDIYRYQQDGSLTEHLTIPISNGGVPLRYWRVQIVNHNDAPLDGVVPHLLAIPRHVIFEQQAGRSYRLLYGQSQAKQPEYDLSRRLNAKQMDAAVEGKLGPEEINTDWSDPRPWTEQHDVLLWLVLGIAVILLGYSAVRSLRRSASAPTPNS
ncbi:MAG TPA: DUF3999 family protein [Candidatus Limnocylindria bacterium]|nr:DUF3999 family protein [Candidatus Limnocylindria bacterium]